MVRTRQPTIESAIARIDEETDLVRAERDAFETFRGRLREVQVNEPSTSRATGGPAALATVDPSPSTKLREIRQAYRETVMGVPHYEREYGETLQESLTAELGETLAVHVVDGQVLTPTVHDALVEATEQNRDDREEFLRRLRKERESLRTVADELNDIEARLVELGDRISATDESARLARIDETLETLEQRCSDLATQRQEWIHNRGTRKLSGVDAVSLPQYLYGDMETVTPALTDIASRLDTVRRERMRCLR